MKSGLSYHLFQLGITGVTHQLIFVSRKTPIGFSRGWIELYETSKSMKESSSLCKHGAVQTGPCQGFIAAAANPPWFAGRGEY